jgi:cytochrome P450
MRAYGRTMQQVAEDHIASLRPGDELRAHEVTTRISLDVILRTVFGVDGGALDEGRRLLRGVLEGFSPLLAFTDLVHHPLFPPWRRLRRAQAAYDALVERLVRERRASKEHGEDILGMLLDATWEDGAPLTTREIRDQLLTLLVAGHETTAISLAWATHDLYSQPAVLARLRAELEPLGPSPEPEALARLPYLSGVCDESLRLRPIVSDVLRTLVEPFEFGGYLLPAGASVSVAIEQIHADPAIYPDPSSFRPERFLDKKPGPFEFLPFGGGHRRCIGAAFSDYEARIVLGTLASRLDLQPLGTDQRVRRNITMGPKRGVPVRVLRRRPA